MSATTNQIIGGAMNGIDGSSAVAYGYLIVSLSQDASVNGNTLVASGVEIKILLDENGSVVTSPAQHLWPNDVLSPANTFYTVSAYTAEGQLVWGPNSQQVLSSPSPFNIGAWVPASVNLSSRIEGGAVSSVFGRTGDISAEAGDYAAFYEPLGSGGSPVSSVFGRRGAVVGQSGDYSAAQIANAAATNVSNTFPALQTFNGGLNATFGVFSSYITAPNLTNSFNGRSGSVVPVSGDYSVSQVTGAAPLNSPAFTGTPTGLPFESLTTTGSSGPATLISGVLNIPSYTGGGGGAVSSVFGRTGTVVAASGDYAVAQVTGAAPIASPTFTGTVTASVLAVDTTLGTATSTLLTIGNTGTNPTSLAVQDLPQYGYTALFGSNQTSSGYLMSFDASLGGFGACTFLPGFGITYGGGIPNTANSGAFFQSPSAGTLYISGGTSTGTTVAATLYGTLNATASISSPTINATTGFEVGGTALASTNLSDTANLARLNAANTFSATQKINSTLSIGTVGSSGTWNLELCPPTAGSSVFWIDNTNTQLRFSNGSTPGTAPVTIDSSGNLAVTGAITATTFNSAPISWTAIGNANVGGSLPASNTGNSNTATGQGALASNTSGTGSSAFGANSLNKNTTGAGNTGLGDSALATNISGNYNTAVGFGALTSNTASFNVAVGENCLPNNASGASNTSVGQSSMYENSSGSSNTAVGNTALHDNDTGSSNTAIGLNAGYSTSVALQTMSDSTFIGANAASSTDGLTNMTVLGNGAIGTASNQITLGNASVTSVVTSGVITAASLATTQTATATTTASDHSVPIKIGSTTYYVRLSSTP